MDMMLRSAWNFSVFWPKKNLVLLTHRNT
jgi:hypothetical protein